MNQHKLDEVFESARKSSEVLELVEKYHLDPSVLDDLTVRVGKRGKDFADSQASYFTGQNRIMFDEEFISISNPQQIYDVLYHETVHYLRDLGGYDDDTAKTYSHPLEDPSELAAVREDVKVRRSRGMDTPELEKYLRQRYRGMDLPSSFIKELVASVTKGLTMSASEPEPIPETLPFADEFDFTASPSSEQAKAGEAEQSSEVPLAKPSPNRLPARLSDPTVLSAPLIVAYSYLKDPSPEAKLLARENAHEFLSRLSYMFKEIYPHVYNHDRPKVREIRDLVAVMKDSVVESEASFETNMEMLRQVLLFTIKSRPYLDQHFGFLSHQLKRLGAFEKTASMNPYNSVCPQCGIPAQGAERCKDGFLWHDYNSDKEHRWKRIKADLPDHVTTSEDEPAVKQQVLTPEEMDKSEDEMFTRTENPEYALSLSNLPGAYRDSPDGDSDLGKYLRSIAMKNDGEVEAWLDSPRGKESVLDYFASQLDLDAADYTYQVVWSDEDEDSYEATVILNVNLLISGPRMYLMEFSAPMTGGVDKDWDAYEGPITESWRAIDEKEVEYTIKPITKDQPKAASLHVEASVPGSKDFKYSSVQVVVPEPLKSEILKWSEKNIPEEACHHDEDAHGREDYPHITVMYGLHGDTPEESAELLRDDWAFEVALGPISLFENKEKPYDVVKVEVVSPALHELNAKIKENLEVTNNYPEYKPHLTIAYVKKGEGKKWDGNTDLEGKKFKVDALEFSSKDKEKGASPIPLKSNKTAAYGINDQDELPMLSGKWGEGDAKIISDADWEVRSHRLGIYLRWLQDNWETLKRYEQEGLLTHTSHVMGQNSNVPVYHVVEKKKTAMKNEKWDEEKLAWWKDWFSQYAKNFRFQFGDKVTVSPYDGEPFDAEIVGWHGEEGWSGYYVRKADGMVDFYKSELIDKTASLSTIAGVLDEMLDSNITYHSDDPFNPDTTSDKYPYGTRALRPRENSNLIDVLKELNQEEETEALVPREKPDPARRQVA